MPEHPIPRPVDLTDLPSQANPMPADQPMPTVTARLTASAALLHVMRDQYEQAVSSLRRLHTDQLRAVVESASMLGDLASKVAGDGGGTNVQAATLPLSATQIVLAEVAGERVRQEAKWGQQNHDDHPAEADNWLGAWSATAEAWKRRNGDRVADLNDKGAPSDRNCYWDGILLEEVFEAVAEDDPLLLRAELVQAAAVAVAWVEAIDRRLAAVVRQAVSDGS